jgi:hypothetical protein
MDYHMPKEGAFGKRKLRGLVWAALVIPFMCPTFLLKGKHISNHYIRFVIYFVSNSIAFFLMFSVVDRICLKFKLYDTESGKSALPDTNEVEFKAK